MRPRYISALPASCNTAMRKALMAALLVVSWGVPTLTAQVTPVSMEGKTFWAGFMQNAYGAQALNIQIGSRTATSGTVSVPLGGWSTPFTVAANAVTTVSIPLANEHYGSEVISNLGLLISAQDSVFVRAVSSQNFTTDATAILPIEALGTDYIAAGYRGLPGFGDFYKSELLIVATADQTQLEITPSVNTSGGRPAGVPFTVLLNAGQTYQLQSQLAALDITGTRIRATAQSGPCRPFAVFAGSMCANIPVGCPACDHIFEQMEPIPNWGTEFRTVPLRGVNRFSYRVLAQQNSTLVFVNGAQVATLNAGQYHEVNASVLPSCIQASHPIALFQLMEGNNCAGTGDPSLLHIEPFGRSSKHAVYKTPASNQINQHGISLAVPTSAVGQVSLDGMPVPASAFTAYASCPAWSYAVVNTVAGTHVLTSSTGFHAYASGVGTGESYAFALGSTAAAPPEQDSILCVSGQVTLNAPFNLSNVYWTAASDPNTVLANGNSYTFTPLMNDTITVHGELPLSGCPEHFDFIIGASPAPNLTLSANGQSPLTACQFTPVQLQALPPPDPLFFNMNWGPAGLVSTPNSSSTQAFPFAPTWFTFTLQSPVGCGGYQDSVFVDMTPANVTFFKAKAPDTLLCLGETVPLQTMVEKIVLRDHLNGSAGAMWATLQGGTVSNACGSVTGDALYFNGATTRSAATQPVNMSNGGKVRFSLKIANGTAPCDDADPGENVVLEYSINGGVNWTTFATYNEAAYPSFTAITATVPLAAQTAATRFRWRQLLHSGAGQDNWALDEVYLSAIDGSGLSYNWSPAGVMANPNAQNTLCTPTSTGWYHVTAMDPNSLCTYSDSVFLTVAPAFTLSTTNDTTLCNVSGVQLNAAPSSGTGITYAWAPNNGTLSANNIPNPIATPSSTTSYTVTATNNIGCVATGNVLITVGQLIGVTASTNDPLICQGDVAQLNAVVQGNANTVLSWNNASTLSNAGIPNPVAGPVSTTIYTVTLTDTVSGCSVQSSVTVNVSTSYTLNLTSDTTVCNAQGFQLNAQHNVPPPLTIQWTPAGLLNAANIPSPTILFDTTATYTVTILDANGCGVSGSVTVTDAFDAMISPVNLSTCQGQTLSLDAGFPGSNYAWNHGPTTQIVNVNSSGTYTVTITDALGCQTIKTFNVTFVPVPAVNLGPDLELCGQNAVTLNANSPGNSVVWSNNTTGQTTTVTQSGTYTATATTPQGCVSSDNITVTFNPLPVDVLQDITLCETEPAVLDAGNPGSTYLWNTNQTSQNIIVNTSGTYTVTVTNPQNCSATFDATVTFVPSPQVDLGPDTTLCDDGGLVLDAGNPGSDHLWNTGATTQTIVPVASGIHWVQVSNSACTVSDTISVVLNPLPVNTLQDITACVDQAVVLDAGNPGCTYLWSNNATAQTIPITVDGVYSVTVTTPDQCTGTFSATVDLVPFPVVDIGPDTVLCEGDVLTLDAGNPGSTYAWSTGSANASIAVQQGGTYSVTVNNGYCVSSDAMSAVFNPSPSRMAARQFYTCLDEEPHFVVLDAGNPGSDHVWSTGEHSQIILAGAYGWYYVDVVNQFDCALRDSVVVNEFCPASLYVPNSFTPNGDGTNDIWMPVGVNIASLELQVFDRWGGIIFQTNTIGDGWDGTLNGEVVKNDVYVWRMRYRFQEDASGAAGQMREQMGHVQVIR